MTTQEVLARVKEIQSGKLDRTTHFPLEWKAEMAQTLWLDAKFSYGMEYGYLLAMADIINGTDSTYSEDDSEDDSA